MSQWNDTYVRVGVLIRREQRFYLKQTALNRERLLERVYLLIGKRVLNRIIIVHILKSLA